MVHLGELLNHFVYLLCFQINSHVTDYNRDWSIISLSANTYFFRREAIMAFSLPLKRSRISSICDQQNVNCERPKFLTPTHQISSPSLFLTSSLQPPVYVLIATGFLSFKGKEGEGILFLQQFVTSSVQK